MTEDTKGRTLAEIIGDLSKEIPQRFLSTKKKGGRDLTIFTWVTTQRMLDLYAPGWNGDTVLTYSGERVGCVYRLCIPTSDAGLVCRAASGDDSEDDEDATDQQRRAREFGSPTTRAEGQAFKRAAARFGFGLYLRDGILPKAAVAPPKQPATAPKIATHVVIMPPQLEPVEATPSQGDQDASWRKFEQSVVDRLAGIGCNPDEQNDFLDAVYAHLKNTPGGINDRVAQVTLWTLIKKRNNAQEIQTLIADLQPAVEVRKVAGLGEGMLEPDGLAF